MPYTYGGLASEYQHDDVYSEGFVTVFAINEDVARQTVHEMMGGAAEPSLKSKRLQMSLIVFRIQRTTLFVDCVGSHLQPEFRHRHLRQFKR
jgi:hypothetical protein